MIKHLFSLRLCSLLVGFSLLMALPAQAQFRDLNATLTGASLESKSAKQSARAQEVERLLQQTSALLNNAWNSQYPNDPIFIQPLSMSNPSLLLFVKSNFEDLETRSHAGDPALSAFYQARGMINGRTTPVCYLLFNKNRLSDLDNQFFLSSDPDSQMATAIFLAAHEFGHCLDQKDNAKTTNALDSAVKNRWGEFGADLFGALLMMDVTHNQELLEKITIVREQGGATHRTSEGLRELLREINQKELKTEGFQIKDFWNLADTLRKKTFK